MRSRCAYGVLHFTICALATLLLLEATRAHDQRIIWFINFTPPPPYHPIGMCYLEMIWLDYFEIQEFLLVYGHKCWSVPKKCSPLSPQVVRKRHDWYSMRCTMSSKWLWVIIRYCCVHKHHVGRCSGPEQYLDTWTAPYTCWRDVVSHFHFYPRCHILSLVSWCNLDPSFH